MVEQQSHHFDDLIIEEILTRLPVESILRFKSVSKQWYSLLSSPNFIISHFTKSSLSHRSTPVNTLFLKSGTNCYLFNYDDDDDEDDQISRNFEDNLVKLNLDFDGEVNKFMLAGCCNGLICLSQEFAKDFILWNPATSKVHKYGSSDENFNGSSRVGYGFGYASSDDDYKYVRIATEFPGVAHIFAIRENKWREIEFNQDGFCLGGHGVLIDEKLYWHAFCPRRHGQLVIRFDLGRERFDIVKLGVHDSLQVMGGCFATRCYSDSNRGDMLRHIFESPEIMKSSRRPTELAVFHLTYQMIGFTRIGKVFVIGSSMSDYRVRFRDYKKVLWLVDTHTNPMGYSKLMVFDDTVDIIRYFPSLLSPFPIEELSEKLN